MTTPILAVELDVLHWYLVARRAPAKTSPVQPEHWATPIFREAWRAARDDRSPGLLELGLPFELASKISDHHGAGTGHGLRISESKLVENWARELLLNAADKLIERWQRDPTVPVSECTEHMREAIAQAEAGQLQTSESATVVRERFIRKRIESWKEGAKPRNVPIGIPEIQRDIGGFLRGKLHLWGAPTSGHKTTIARTHAEWAGSHGFESVYYPLEDSPEDIEARSIVASRDELTTRTVHGDRFPGTEAEMRAFIESVDHAPPALRYARCGRTTLSRLCSMIRNEATRGLSAVFVDHLHRLRPDGRDGFEFWCSVGDTLADLAVELDIAIVAMAQLDKPSQSEASRGEAFPTMAGLRYGTALIQPARSVYMIHRLDTRIPDDEPTPADFEKKAKGAYDKARELWLAKKNGLRVLKIKCEKNTNGPLGEWVFECDPAHDRIGRLLWSE